MGEQCQHLDGRVVIRGRDGAPERLRSGLVGVGVFVGAVAAVPVAAVLGILGVVLALSDGPVTVDTDPLVPADPAAAAELLLPLAPLLAVYVVGALGFLVYWRRRYDVRVEIREGLLRWD